jgi:DNA-binding protein H-NS
LQTYDSIQAEIAAVQSEAQAKVAELQKQAATARKEAVANAVRDIKQIMTQYGLTVADLGSITSKAAKSASKSGTDNRTAVAPKYRDNRSDATWTGRGKAPKWLAAHLAAGATKEQFLIPSA